MSGIKTLFEKQKQSISPFKPAQVNSIQDLSYEVNSSEYVTQYNDSINLYLQDVNFATASNFAKFGSARKYYENIVTRITNYFPYDGSKAKQLEFENNLNPFEKYIYLYQYPRSTGYVNLSPGGWGTQTDITSGFGNPTSKEYISFYNINNNNVYDPDNNLRENTRFVFTSGSTIEFWLKKNDFPNTGSQTNKEAVFYTATTGSDNKDKRFVIYVTGQTNNSGSIFAQYYTSNATEQFQFQFDTGLSTIADSNWHHYALTFYSGSTGYASEFYFDGVYKSSTSSSGIPIDLTGSAFCTLGSLGGRLSGSTDLTGWGKLSGSIDEFRFWNTRRDAKQIGLNYFVNVGGGNNVANTTDLGVYYKFNEGILNDSNYDSVILDYAGRNCNGSFTGYNSSSRSTGSAITDTQEKPEIGTPILYYNHPNVQTFLTEQLYYADEYDFTNNFALKNSLPSWILDQDATNGETLTNFLQTLASYFDTLYLQITTYKNLKNKDYLNYKGKAPPFSDLLLTSHGFDLPSLFLNTDAVQYLLNQDSKRTYDESINNLKNVIYKNIYNNLDIIYKSKGTEKSIQQLIKTFGVDEDVFSLNIYANNTIYTLEDSYVNKSIKKSFIDFTPFSYSQNSQAVIYQSGSYISGATGVPFTVECDFITPAFPKTYDTLAYQTLTYNTSSVFGIRTAKPDPTNLTISGSDAAGLKAKLIYRDNKGYFSLSGSSLPNELTSSVFDDLMENQHWNLSFRIVPNSSLNNYELIFSGYSNFVGNQFRQFKVSQSLNTAQGDPFVTSFKRLYVGAERQDVTGTLAFSSMVKSLSARFWADYLEDDELMEHARNPDNSGRLNPADPYLLSTASYLPKSETLLLHWDFTNVTSSDANGNVDVVYDLTSGSSYSTAPLTDLLPIVYNGAGYGFEPSQTIGGVELVYSSQQQLPENLYSSQLIDVLETDDNYTNLIRPQKYFFSLENSMYDTISKNMLNLFSSIIEFNNFIGEPMNTYKTQYNKLRSFRKTFFDKVENIPDLDIYIGVYKWIDDALDSILVNLLPASANASEKVRTIVENHILERNKVNYPLVPDKNSKVDGGSSKEVPVNNSKGKKFFNDKLVPPYNPTMDYTPPEGSYATDFLDPISITGQDVVNQSPVKHLATKAARIGRR